MNHYCVIQQNAFTTHEESRSSVSERKDPVVCPKPRRLGLISATTATDVSVRTLRWHLSHQADVCDTKSGNDLLDLVLTRGGYGLEQSCTQVASSPPFFGGSPPSRVANPLIRDVQFGDEKVSPILECKPIPPSSGSSTSSPTSSTRKGGCVRGKFGSKPAVRIEGFDCLDRDCRNCSISALA